MTDTNQREFTRVPSGMEVDLKFYEGTEIAGLLDNISMRGLFLPSDHTMPEGSACDITIFLGGRGQGLALKMKGQVTRCTDGGIGIRFDEILMRFKAQASIGEFIELRARQRLASSIRR
jgi:hypothetical protein